VRQLAAVLAGALALAPGMLRAQDDAAGRPGVVSVRHWSYPTYTRVVLELQAPVKTSLERLPADPRAHRPERLYVDLPGFWVGHDWDTPVAVGDGLLQGIRLGQFQGDRARLVLDLDHYQRHRVFALSGPHRLVIDVYGDAARSLPAVSSAPPTQAPGARAPELVDDRLLVVIDPGHGGDDPGTIGAHGVQEKDITLAVGRALRQRLLERGFAVLMTRESDRTLSLEERTAFAEGARGDLFVSIHVNSAPRWRVQGIETYYLDASHERHTLRVAARESGVAPAELDALARTLASFRVSEVGARSSRLARAVQSELVAGVREEYGSATDLGVKRGPFHVLFLSSAPSVLVEVGFLSNPGEATRLRTVRYHELVAEQIARGLARYRKERTPVIAQGAAS
jgi:N-acetylmuramoyl-L-alanine amidase